MGRDRLMLDVYLSHPGNQLQAHMVSGLPVLVSFANVSKWLEEYICSFGKLLIDSGAFSVLSSGRKVDLVEYKEWSSRCRDRAEAIAGLDDIEGNWRMSLRNYEKIPWSFPTYHDTDPPELLDDLIDMARERGKWIGVGVLPPRGGKETWVRETLEKIPDDLHVHGWALAQYRHIRGFSSLDSTSWFRRAMQIKQSQWCSHLTYAECLEIEVKSYRRNIRRQVRHDSEEQMEMFRCIQ